MVGMVGIAVCVLGVVFLVMGISAADSIGSSFPRFFTGNPTDKSIWLMIGGIACILLGSGGFNFSRGRRNRQDPVTGECRERGGEFDSRCVTV